jgi:CMP-N-acetylneuraminic acid synthetase/regulator of RNase E activity RraA
MKIVAFVPAKGSSERIVNKNLSVLDGEYLFKRKLRQLLNCHLINEVFLDTDSEEIANLARDLPVRIIKRPKELASNATDGHDLFAWECQQCDADIYIQALCTAPFVTDETIERAILELIGSSNNDSLVAMSYAKQYTWEKGEPNYGRGRIPNSVDLPQINIESMALYMIKASALSTKKRFGLMPLFFELNPTELIDINWPSDIVLAETVASGIRAQENLSLGALLPYLSSAMFSDITREMGYKHSLPKELVGQGRFFGKAKTLLLDKPLADESWERIYDGLNTYEFIRPGDVIVVENRVQDHAYFGNLNCQLALRAGAVGAVVNGLTRDKADVEKLNFPVFSRGHYCVDIKFEGIVRSMNAPIEIGGVKIENNDFIFADADGTVVIPSALWPEVRERVLKGIEREWRIGQSVALGKHPREIYQELGQF